MSASVRTMVHHGPQFSGGHQSHLGATWAAAAPATGAAQDHVTVLRGGPQQHRSMMLESGCTAPAIGAPIPPPPPSCGGVLLTSSSAGGPLHQSMATVFQSPRGHQFLDLHISVLEANNFPPSPVPWVMLVSRVRLSSSSSGGELLLSRWPSIVNEGGFDVPRGAVGVQDALRFEVTPGRATVARLHDGRIV